MVILEELVTGTTEKGDIQLHLFTNTAGNQVLFKVAPHPRFEEHIRKLILGILSEFEVENTSVEISDFGALDFVIEARLRAAVKEARGDKTC